MKSTTCPVNGLLPAAARCRVPWRGKVECTWVDWVAAGWVERVDWEVAGLAAVVNKAVGCMHMTHLTPSQVHVCKVYLVQEFTRASCSDQGLHRALRLLDL